MQAGGSKRAIRVRKRTANGGYTSVMEHSIVTHSSVGTMDNNDYNSVSGASRRNR